MTVRPGSFPSRDGGGERWSVFSNGPIDSSTWCVEIDNEVPATTTFDSFGVCLAKKNSEPITTLRVSTVDTQTTVPANSVQTADVSCGPASLVTGSGHEIQSIGRTFWSIQASAPVSVNDWQVKVADLDTFSRVFDSDAVCPSKAP